MALVVTAPVGTADRADMVARWVRADLVARWVRAARMARAVPEDRGAHGAALAAPVALAAPIAMLDGPARSAA